MLNFTSIPVASTFLKYLVPEAEVSQRAVQSYMDAMARALHPNWFDTLN